MSEMGRNAWQQRSESWVASAAAGKSPDDSFNQMIIAAAAIRPGESVLDTASGTGNPAVSIALSMAGRGSVIASDFTCSMLQAARQRATTLSLAILRFACCDMTALPFPDHTFDCVTCRFGLMSVGDKDAAAAEAMRVLRPGGRAAYVVWGPYEENPPFYVPRRAAARFFGEPEGPPSERHSMSAPRMVKSILDRVGFLRSEERELRYRNTVADPVDYITKGLKRSYGEKVRQMPPDRFAELVRAVLDAWSPFIEDGILHVPNYARLGIGWKGKAPGV
jgi:ubiquinone/menaquinone biosynthesis C-methylase UbiE